MSDFDRIIERRGTHATKWDHDRKTVGHHGRRRHPDVGRGHGFRRPSGVTEALAKTVERGVHGYYADTGSWAAALSDWLARRHGAFDQAGMGQPDAGHRVRARA